MAGELENPAQESTMATEAAPASQPVPANKLQSGNDRLAAILQKQASGGKLTASERGYLGAVKRKGKIKMSPPPADSNPLLEADATAAAPTTAPAAATADNILFSDEPQAQTAAAGLVATAADSAVIKAAAEAILDSVDTATKIYVGHEAAEAGADAATVAQYESAVALQPRNRDLMAKNSEPVILMACKLFGCEPSKLPDVLKNCGFAAGAFAHLMAVTVAVKSIKQSRQEKSP